MNIIPVDSRPILFIGWADGVLRVGFRSGRIYDHPGVPYTIYAALLNAASKGAFYNQNIRGRYR